MKDIVKPDRGTVKRITLDLLYPNGQIKTVVIENNSREDYGTFSAIFLDDHGVENFLNKNPSAAHTTVEEVNELWNNIDKGENPQWKPAIMLVNTKGDLMPRCGAHLQLSPPSRIIK